MLNARLLVGVGIGLAGRLRLRVALFLAAAGLLLVLLRENALDGFTIVAAVGGHGRLVLIGVVLFARICSFAVLISLPALVFLIRLAGVPLLRVHSALGLAVIARLPIVVLRGIITLPVALHAVGLLRAAAIVRVLLVLFPGVLIAAVRF